ncbi:MAG: hypothetical protein OXU63_07105 [Acidobacteriota bacterium]|nr:hypothetical protein [Acidobacteriota bacterium]
MRKARILVDASPDRVHFSLAVPVDFHLEGEAWIASCPLLDVASHGSNRQEAQEMLGEALGAFLFTCYDIGTLDEVLRDCGFEASAENRYSAASTTDRLVPFQMRQQLVQAATAH